MILFSFSGIATVCMDLGHLTLKRGTTPSENGDQSVLSKEAKVIIVNLSSSARHFVYHRISNRLENYPIRNLN